MTLVVNESSTKNTRMKNINDRKFAFLSEITRPDYRSKTETENVEPTIGRADEEVEQETVEVTKLVDERYSACDSYETIEEGSDVLMRAIEMSSNAPLADDEDVMTPDEDDLTRCVHEEVNADISEESKLSETIEAMVPNVDATSNDDISEMSEMVLNSANIFADNSESHQKNIDDSLIVQIDGGVVSPCHKVTPSKDKQKSEEIDLEEERQLGSPRKAVYAKLNDVQGESDDDSEVPHATNIHNRTLDIAKKLWHTDSQPTTSAFLNIATSVDRAHSANDLLDGIGVIKEDRTMASNDKDAIANDEDKVRFTIASEPSTPDHILHSSDDLKHGSEDFLHQSIKQLEKQLRISDVRCARLEKICQFQQKDIDSLRFEMEWKDARIEYLQKTLRDIEEVAEKKSNES